MSSLTDRQGAPNISNTSGFAPLTLAGVRANLADSPHTSVAEQLELEAARHIGSALKEDVREAATAFVEKQTPVFHGR